MTAAAVVFPVAAHFPRIDFCPLTRQYTLKTDFHLLFSTFSLCLSAFDVPLSPFFSFAPANRDIADALGHENLSSRIWSNVEKNVSRCLL